MDSYWPLATFAFVASITPGPNNLMLAASGVAFGLKRTLPHMLGVPVGFALLLVGCALGVGALITELPAAALALKLFGTGYLIYLTWRLRRAFDLRGDSTPSDERRARPLSFTEGLLFQFANPKAWIMSLTAVSVFLPPAAGPRGLQVALFSAVFIAVVIPCIGVWATAGAGARRLLTDVRWRRGFAALIVALMAYTVVAIWV